ncbi:MAG: DnaJ C-terminal domain-containing protein, partial [bacterium]|nr:DnaJ C-terminal domain-containing protein [bacterium]
LDLFLVLPLSIAEATLGATVTVPGVRGKVDLSIPPKSDSGNRLRLKGQGLEDDAGRKGDLYVTVAISTPDPTKLSPDQIAAMKTISSAAGPLRTGSAWQ